MATTTLKMNTNVREGVRFVMEEGVDPIIDLDNVRYLIDVEKFIIYGALIWTRFDLQTQLPLDGVSYTRRYAAHNRFYDLLEGTLGSVGELDLQTSDFPTYTLPDDLGTVTP